MEGVGAASEFSGDVDEVTGPGPRAENGPAAGNGSQDHNVGEDFSGRLCRISSGERHTELLGEGQEAIEEAVDPSLGQLGRDGEGKEGRERFAPHGGDIAEAAGKATVADHLGRVPVTAEVDIF